VASTILGQAAKLVCACPLQVCVAALCIKQKDLLHAGYLAITLLFFRQRTQLMMAPAAPHGTLVRGARLFLWLPAFNLLVMGLTLLYQVSSDSRLILHCYLCRRLVLVLWLCGARGVL
jgi:hypothetical protein